MSALFKTQKMIGLSIAVLLALVDQLSKTILIRMLIDNEEPVVLTSFFNLVMVWNRGISFGMLGEHGAVRVWLLIGMTLIIVAILLRWLWKSDRTPVSLALGLVIGGAVGNIIDRVLYGAVADFFDFHAFGYHWPAFNVADISIVLGVAILCWQSMVVGELKPRSEP